MLVHEVFDKVLYLTPSARAQFSSGRIFNLVTTDAETLQMLFQNILGVISSPARIIGSMAMLYVQLGPSSLVALAVLILMMPAQVGGHTFYFVISAYTLCFALSAFYFIQDRLYRTKATVSNLWRCQQVLCGCSTCCGLSL